MAWLFFSLVPPVWGEQYFLYSPRPITPEETKDAKDGVLVREVEVRQGDTLYRISRHNSGHGMYYPQILLFNKIRNPNLIHTGDTLKVPVTKGPSAGEEVSAPVHRKKKSAHKAGRKHMKPSAGSKKKRAGNEGGVEAASGAREPVVAGEAKPPVVSRREKGAAGTADAAAGQQLFERAIKAYRQGDCRTALDLFDRFLASYPDVPQAADASLYKADCYLKLSGQ